MSLSKTDKRNLKIINENLKSEHGYKIPFDENTPKDILENIHNKVSKQQRELSFSKNPQSNPEYTQTCLVLEATKILLGKKNKTYIQESKKSTGVYNQLKELELLAESFKDKNPQKARKIQEKVDSIKNKMYVESKEKELRSYLAEDAQEAEIIMASRNLLDTVQGFQTKIGDLMNKNLDPFIDRVRTIYGSEVADDLYDNMDKSLSDLLTQVKSSKEVFANAVGVLSGSEDTTDSVSDMSNATDELDDDDSLDGLEGMDERDTDIEDDQDKELNLDDTDDETEEVTDQVDQENSFKRKKD